MAGPPPPPLRDDRLDLVTLSAMARTFDQISMEAGGQLWPATDFVRWLANEWRASRGEASGSNAGSNGDGRARTSRAA